MRTLLTLVLTVLIVLSTVLTMSLAFVVVGGLATLLVYYLTDSLETALAAGLLAGFGGWLGASFVPDVFAGVQGYDKNEGSRFQPWTSQDTSLHEGRSD